MPSLGPMEILVVLVVALLIFGPNKLPEVARQVGRAMREFHTFREHVMGELKDAVDLDGTGAGTAAGSHDGTPPFAEPRQEPAASGPVVDSTPPTPADPAPAPPASPPAPATTTAGDVDAAGLFGPGVGGPVSPPAAAAAADDPGPEPRAG